MREDKRFRILEHKDFEYIFDTENTPAFWNDNVDIIELIGDSLSEQEIVDLLNKQDEEIKNLKEDNDIKFWKQEYMKQHNSTQLLLHELNIVINEGYEVSAEFKQYTEDLDKRIKWCIEKEKRLFNNE